MRLWFLALMAVPPPFFVDYCVDSTCAHAGAVLADLFFPKGQSITTYLVMIVGVDLVAVKTCASSDWRLYHQVD